MAVLVTPTRNPNPSRVPGPLWWLVCQLLANWPGSTNSGTFAPKTGSHDTRDGQSSDNYSCRDPLNRQGPGDKAAAFDQSFPTAAGMVEVGQVVSYLYATNDPRVYALFEALGEADWDYDPEGFVFYPTRRMRVPDRTHKTHWHWGLIRAFMGEDARSWKAVRDLASALCRETLAVWQSGRSIFADPATWKDDDMQPVLIQIKGDATVSVVSMGVGHIPLSSETDLRNMQSWMRGNGMKDTVFPWEPSWRPLMGPDLRYVNNVGAVQAAIAANNAAEQARDASLAAAVGAMATLLQRATGHPSEGGSVQLDTQYIVDQVTSAVREAAASHTVATAAIYDELVAAKQDLRRLEAAEMAEARGTLSALESQESR